jgi:hypothetical protein
MGGGTGNRNENRKQKPHRADDILGPCSST